MSSFAICLASANWLRVSCGRSRPSSPSTKSGSPQSAANGVGLWQKWAVNDGVTREHDWGGLKYW